MAGGVANVIFEAVFHLSGAVVRARHSETTPAFAVRSIGPIPRSFWVIAWKWPVTPTETQSLPTVRLPEALSTATSCAVTVSAVAFSTTFSPIPVESFGTVFPYRAPSPDIWR